MRHTRAIEVNGGTEEEEERRQRWEEQDKIPTRAERQ